MSSDRYVVLGLAHVRSGWFRAVSRWATSAVVPLEFVKCVSVDELRARLDSGRVFSALLVDAGLPGIDRDLVEHAREIGCAVIAVADPHDARDLAGLGVSTVLPHAFESSILHAALREHSTMIGSALAEAAPAAVDAGAGPAPWRGQVIAVTGAGGSGTSTVAMALAQGLAHDVRSRGRVLLADLALDADQAVLHDARDVVPGVQELAEAHRHGSPGADELARLTFGDGHPYRVLLGLRRHRDWTALRQRSFTAAFEGLRRHHTYVVCDVDPDIEGETESGSMDIEERNLMARTAVGAASLVVLTGTAGVQGTHRLVRLVSRLVDHGVPPERILPVVNRAPRSARQRAEASRTVAALVSPAIGAAASQLASPLFLAEHRRLDQLVHDGVGAPSSMASTLARAAFALLDRSASASPHEPAAASPVLVTPGSLGSWAADQEAAG